MLNLAIAGVAHIHIPSYVRMLKQRTDVRVVAVWDHDPERAAKYALELKSRPVHRLSEAIQLADALLVCSQTVHHLEVITQIANAGRHLYVEKPLGMNAAESCKIARLIHASEILFQIGYAKRSLAYNRFLRDQIVKGTLGKITRVRASCVHGGALGPKFDHEWRWMTDPALSGGGAFFDLGVHGLDLLIWMFGAVDSVTATMGSALSRYPGCDEFGEGLLRFSSGVVATLAAGWVDLTDIHDLLVWGTEGHACITRDDRLFFKSKNVPGADGIQAWQFTEKVAHPFINFLDALNGSASVELIPAYEAARVDCVMEGFYTAASERRWVTPCNAEIGGDGIAAFARI